MAEINDGDVHNLNDQPIDADDYFNPLSHSVDLQQTDLINTLKSAMLLRGDIRCRLTTKFKCGYEIRPIIWFSKQTDELDATLEKIGLTWKQTFVRTEDITKLCHVFSNFFNLSTKSQELKIVESLNGVLPQPLDYQEVEEALSQIESIVSL
jgi:hypothetical protein